MDRFHVFHDGTFQMEAGEYIISVGASSQDIRMHDKVQLAGHTLTDSTDKNASLFDRLYGQAIPEETSVKPYTLNSTLDDIKDTFIGKKMYQKIQKEMQGMFVGDYDESLKLMFEGMVKEMPLRQLISMSNGTLTMRTMKGLIALMNKRVFSALKIFIN
jgi:beta-glucosidase